jgi:hypothetical protein
VKVGDLVKLSVRKTRKGMPYDNMVGVITKIGKPVDGFTFVKAVFDVEYTFNITDLDVVSKSV